METYPRDQRFRFRLDLHDGTSICGGTETKQDCIDHLRHCLWADKRIKAAWYLGKDGFNLVEREIKKWER